jgi:hypothetical protein
MGNNLFRKRSMKFLLLENDYQSHVARPFSKNLWGVKFFVLNFYSVLHILNYYCTQSSV